MKICFIGLGSIGTRHCLNFVAICKELGISLTIDAVRATQHPLKETLQPLGIRCLRSFDEMDCMYDAIFVTNPTSLHYDTMCYVGSKSKYFFIEKPIFDQENMDVSAFQLLPGAVCYVASPLRYTNVLQEAKRFVQNHKVFSARAISSSYLPEWRTGQDYRQTYSAHKSMGGGVSIDLIHEWDYMSMLFGMPQKVHSFIGKYSDLEIDSDDLAVYIATYPTHLVELHLDYFGRETVRKLELWTKEGCTVFDIAHSCILSWDGKRIDMSEQINDRYKAELQFFLSLMKDGSLDNPNSIQHACQVLNLTKGGTL